MYVIMIIIIIIFFCLSGGAGGGAGGIQNKGLVFGRIRGVVFERISKWYSVESVSGIRANQ